MQEVYTRREGGSICLPWFKLILQNHSRKQRAKGLIL